MYGSGLTALGLRRRPDVIVGFQPSLAAGVLASTASRIHRRPFGIIIHDLLGLGAKLSGVEGGGGVAAAVERVELATARRASGLAIVAESFRPYFQDKGIPASRIRRVRTWTRRDEPSESRSATRSRLGWSDDNYFCVHAGNMGQKQGLDNILDAAALLTDERKIQFALVGGGNDRQRLQQRARDMKLTNMRFVDGQPPGEFEAVLGAADLLLLNQRAGIGDMSLPSKLTSYFGAGRPVVAAVAPDGETAQEMHAAQAGVVVAADDPAALVEAVRYLRDEPERAAAYGERARVYAETMLAADAILADYERFVMELAETGIGA